MSDDKDLMTLKTTLNEPVGRGDIEDTTSSPPPPSQDAQARESGVPLMGIFAIGFALLSIVTFAPLFTPLGILFGIIALFMGQVLMGMSAIGLAVIGGLTSPILLTLFSIGAFLSWLGL